MSFANKIRKATVTLAAVAAMGSGIAVTEASAAGYSVHANAQTTNFPNWDRLNIRKWPAAHSEKVAHIKVDRGVYVERCIIKEGADWCKIRRGWKEGWVNGRFIARMDHDFVRALRHGMPKELSPAR